MIHIGVYKESNSPNVATGNPPLPDERLGTLPDNVKWRFPYMGVPLGIHHLWKPPNVPNCQSRFQIFTDV